VGAVHQDQLRLRRGLRRRQPADERVRHRAQRPEPAARDLIDEPFQRGLELARERRWFEAHEELELAWRAADAHERDFFQGLVHVVVAWYQAGRGNRVGCERQLEKAQRRLSPFAPQHRGVTVATLLDDVERARAVVAKGSLELGEPEGFEQPLEA
jgi:predicted metal-dependent hydrolase